MSVAVLQHPFIVEQPEAPEDSPNEAKPCGDGTTTVQFSAAFPYVATLAAMAEDEADRALIENRQSEPAQSLDAVLAELQVK